jgi:hypothetical protein
MEQYDSDMTPTLHDVSAVTQAVPYISKGAIVCKHLSDFLQQSTARVFVFDTEETRWYRIVAVRKCQPEFVLACYETTPGYHKWKVLPWHTKFTLWLGEQ